MYSRRPQPVARLDVALAIADIGRREYEEAHPMEAMLALMNTLPG